MISSIIFIIVFSMIFFLSIFDSCSYVTIGTSPEPDYGGITHSTVVRQPMPSQYLVEIDECYYDGPGVIESAAGQFSLENSLKHFHEKTGVQPYLYIANELYGDSSPDFDAVEKFMNDKYYELFSDEGHILVLYFEYESGEYNTWYMVGNDAGDLVLDEEACEILLDYIDHYYKSSDTADYADLFTSAFHDAADRIMGGRTNGPNLVDIVVTVAFVAVIIVIIVSVVKNYRRTKPGGNGGNGGKGGDDNDSSDDNMSEEDRRKERYRKKYGG